MVEYVRLPPYFADRLAYLSGRLLYKYKFNSSDGEAYFYLNYDKPKLIY